MSGLRIDVADLLAHPGSRRDVWVRAEVVGLAVSASRVEGPLEVRASLERISDGIVARGAVIGHWVAECSRCLRPLDEPFALGFDELFETDPLEGETYPIAGHEIDLEQLARDTVGLELPLAPHCPEPCALEVAQSDEGDDADLRDPRWAALSELDL
jgi:uncharacterized protein